MIVIRTVVVRILAAGTRMMSSLDINGSPLTNAGKTIERFRRVNVGLLDIEITIDDPKAYTRPFTVRLRQRLMPDTEIIEMVCQENNLSIQHIPK